jgi:hypothetical protein
MGGWETRKPGELGTDGTHSNTPPLTPRNYPRRSTFLMTVQPPISTIPCKILYSLANPMLPFPMFSSPAASPTIRSPRPRPPHSNRCHPERSEGSAFCLPPLSALSVSAFSFPDVSSFNFKLSTVAQTSVCALLRQSSSEGSEAKDPQELKAHFPFNPLQNKRHLTNHRDPSIFRNFSFCVCCPGRLVSCLTQFNSFGTLPICLVGS